MSESSIVSNRAPKEVNDDELFEIELTDFRPPPKADDNLASNEWVWKEKEVSEVADHQDIIMEEETIQIQEE